jgi:hypothetical protein
VDDERPNDTKVAGAGPARKPVIGKSMEGPHILCSRLLGRSCAAGRCSAVWQFESTGEVPADFRLPGSIEYPTAPDSKFPLEERSESIAL